MFFKLKINYFCKLSQIYGYNVSISVFFLILLSIENIRILLYIFAKELLLQWKLKLKDLMLIETWQKQNILHILLTLLCHSYKKVISVSEEKKILQYDIKRSAEHKMESEAVFTH